MDTSWWAPTRFRAKSLENGASPRKLNNPFASMADRPAVANRAMPVLSVMMRIAELRGYRVHNSNPCRNTRRYRTAPRERYLTPEEMARLNMVLTQDEFQCPQAVAAILSNKPGPPHPSSGSCCFRPGGAFPRRTCGASATGCAVCGIAVARVR